jgi:hypothetical protein
VVLATVMGLGKSTLPVAATVGVWVCGGTATAQARWWGMFASGSKFWMSAGGLQIGVEQQEQTVKRRVGGGQAGCSQYHGW